MLLATVLTVALTGCGLLGGGGGNGGGGQITLPTGDGGSATVSADGETLTITDDQGESTTMRTSEGRLPAGFPLPLIPGGTVVSAVETTTNGETGYILEITVKGDIKAAADFYQQAVEGRGLTVNRTDMSADGEESVMLVAEGEKESGWITLTKPAGSDEITIGFVYGHN